MNAEDRNANYPEAQSGAAELRDAQVSDAARFHRLAQEESSPEQIAMLRRMTPGQRWDAAHRLYWTMRRHKAAFLQSQHPDWTEQQVTNEVRRIFSHART
ncbi:MAG: hypothetical protein HOP33_02870 [Verrucomicrobia bacterium]|nr:hypothetical protein [Verrucomicrobiota bacterium]